MSNGAGGSSAFLLRPLEFGEILDQSLRLYFRAWRPLLGLGAIAALPGVILGGVLQTQVTVVSQNPQSSWVLWLFAAANNNNMGAILLVIAGALAVLFTELLLFPMTTGGMIAVCARVYLNQPTTLRDGWRIAGRRYWPLLGTGALFALIAVFAAPVLVIAGLLIFAIFTLPAGYAMLLVYVAFRNLAIVVEGAGGGVPALKRSLRLVNGRFWPLLGLGVVFGFLTYVLTMIVNYVVVLPLTFVQMSVAHSAILGWIMAILGGVGTAAMAPITIAGLTVAYYDVRVRKEGFDLEMAAQAQRNVQEGGGGAQAPS